ncbi:reverse transcriptase domain-containing protein [Tanacetum coccineum]
MSATAIEELITERVADALEDYKANRNSENRNDNGNGSHDSGSDGTEGATLMKMMTEAYCSRSEIKKLETELWNLTVKGTDVESYTQCFQELVLLCSRMILDEADKVERYVGGLPDSRECDGI